MTMEPGALRPTLDILERMQLNPELKRRAFSALALHTDADLAKPDQDGDTNLMIMIANRLPKGYEYLYALVKRLQNIPNALAARNKQNHSALLLACLYMPDQPLVARFVAEAMQAVNYDLNEVYDNGNTILHILCEKGDGYLPVLVELLSMKTVNGWPSFDINRQNFTTGTPLLVAMKVQNTNGNCSQIIAFLNSLGAQPQQMQNPIW